MGKDSKKALMPSLGFTGSTMTHSCHQSVLYFRPVYRLRSGFSDPPMTKTLLIEQMEIFALTDMRNQSLLLLLNQTLRWSIISVIVFQSIPRFQGEKSCG
jgi:hypothetical protein